MIIESRYITHPLNYQRLSLVAPLEWFRECVVEVFIGFCRWRLTAYSRPHEIGIALRKASAQCRFPRV